MRVGAEGRPGADRLYAFLLHVLPGEFRREFAGEMLGAFEEWYRWRRGLGVQAGARFWAAALGDLARSAVREWGVEVRRRLVRGGDTGGAYRPPYGEAALAGVAVLTLYVATLAPTIAFWDAAEYVTVAHILGIPHPPGNPLFVLVAHGWERLLSPLGLPVAVSINLFSATFSAAAHAFWFLVVHRSLAGWTEDRLLRSIGAAAAVVLSATAFTVWNQSNVNEKVYTLSFFTTALVSWLLIRWRDGGRGTKMLLVVSFLVALTATNHLMGVLVAPAVAVFVLMVDRRELLRRRLWAGGIALAMLGLSVQFFLPIRAAQQPILAEGGPECESVSGMVASVYTWGRAGRCEALSHVLQRKQYVKPPVTADPTDPRLPRSASLVAAQLANYAQYFNWQWARSVAGHDPLFGGPRSLFTLAFLLLGVVGARRHWLSDRQSAAYLGTLFLTLSLGLVLYLNFKYGYAIGWDRFPEREMHEVRERDYFFLIGFGIWGLWAGIGLAAVWAAAAERLRGRLPLARLAAAPILAVGLLPVVLNWGWASRADDYAARDWAYNALMSVAPYGVLVTNGDNDTFPLWFLQEVEGLRRDVTIVNTEYVKSDWYVRQLRELTRPCPPGVDPADQPTRIVCQRPFDAADLPAPLVEAGWAQHVKPPEDSIFPLTDDEIDSISRNAFVTREPLTLHAGNIQTTILPGTPMGPQDIFAAAMLQATLDQRPVHFMPGSPIAHRLGLYNRTVRHGVVWKLHNGPPPADANGGVVPLPDHTVTQGAGAAIDLPLTDTLVWDVYLRRGRIVDPSAPWMDAAVRIPMQYVSAHYTAAQAYAAHGGTAAAERHMRRADWWLAVLGG